MRHVVRFAKAPLVPQVKAVTRGGKTHTQIYWIDPETGMPAHKETRPGAVKLEDVGTAPKGTAQGALDFSTQPPPTKPKAPKPAPKPAPKVEPESQAKPSSSWALVKSVWKAWAPQIEAATVRLVFAQRATAKAEKAFRRAKAKDRRSVETDLLLEEWRDKEDEENKLNYDHHMLVRRANKALLEALYTKPGKITIDASIAPDGLQDAKEHIARLFGPKLDLNVALRHDPNMQQDTAAYYSIQRYAVFVRDTSDSPALLAHELVHAIEHSPQDEARAFAEERIRFFEELTKGQTLKTQQHLGRDLYQYYDLDCPDPYAGAVYPQLEAGVELTSNLIQGLYEAPHRWVAQSPHIVQWFLEARDKYFG